MGSIPRAVNVSSQYKIQNYPDKMLLMSLVLVLLVSTPGLPRPESRHRRQIMATQSCEGACSQNILTDGGLVTRVTSSQTGLGGSVQQQQVLARGGTAGGVFGPFGAFSQIFG